MIGKEENESQEFLKYEDFLEICEDLEEEMEGCTCGHYCFDCLGMSRSDFM
jgi:hypothetical protein